MSGLTQLAGAFQIDERVEHQCSTANTCPFICTNDLAKLYYIAMR
jgi:hypothetical protein